MNEQQLRAYVDACASNGIVLAADERDRVIDHFTSVRAGGARVGRRSQTRVRMPRAWRVVAVHVSLLGDGTSQ